MQRNSKTAIKSHRGGPRSANPTRTRTGKSPEQRKGHLDQGADHRDKLRTSETRAARRLREPPMKMGTGGSSWTQRAPRKMERGPQEQKALLRHGEWSIVTGEDHGQEERTTDTGTRMHITETRRRAKKSGRGSWKWREAHRHQKTHKGRMWTQKAH